MQTVPQVPLGRPATYDDLMKVPDNLVAEIVDEADVLGRAVAECRELHRLEGQAELRHELGVLFVLTVLQGIKRLLAVLQTRKRSGPPWLRCLTRGARS